YPRRPSARMTSARMSGFHAAVERSLLVDACALPWHLLSFLSVADVATRGPALIGRHSFLGLLSWTTAMSIWRWAHAFDSVDEPFRITLGEGDTPLIRSEKIGPSAGLRNLFFKLELANPTGSFKDRFGAAAISHMLANKKSLCIATSS